MARPKSTETKKVNSGIASKLCIRCNKVYGLENFYPNRGWSQQLYHDAWCKTCYQTHIHNAEELKEYCYQNNRHWEDYYWDAAVKTAKNQINVHPDYVNPKSTEETREKIVNKLSVAAFARIMNLKTIYKFEEHEYIQGLPLEDQMPSEEAMDRIYSEEWGGYYTPSEIERLDKKYAKYEEDFVLDNENLRDYAHKVVKASFDADQAADRMRRGEGDSATYKEMQKIFDDLSKSATFAACRRKSEDRTGLGSLGEIILRIEIEGKLEDKGFTFPEDDVDKIIADFRHTLVAVGAEGGLV